MNASTPLRVAAKKGQERQDCSSAAAPSTTLTTAANNAVVAAQQAQDSQEQRLNRTLRQQAPAHRLCRQLRTQQCVRSWTRSKPS
jgi:activator of HSP90 ATPase